MDGLNPTPFLTLHGVRDIKDIMNKMVEDRHNCASSVVQIRLYQQWKQSTAESQVQRDIVAFASSKL
jgi:hypothetical protein